MPTVDESVQLDAPRASVEPVGAEPNLLILPRSEVAAAVPVPLVVPPADSIVRLIELSTVPVTVSVPELLAAEAVDATANSATTKQTAIAFFICFSLVVDFLLVKSRRGGRKIQGMKKNLPTHQR